MDVSLAFLLVTFVVEIVLVSSRPASLAYPVAVRHYDKPNSNLVTEFEVKI